MCDDPFGRLRLSMDDGCGDHGRVPCAAVDMERGDMRCAVICAERRGERFLCVTVEWRVAVVVNVMWMCNLMKSFIMCICG